MTASCKCSASMTFVASVRPPSPVSMTAMSTFSSAKCLCTIHYVIACQEPSLAVASVPFPLHQRLSSNSHTWKPVPLWPQNDSEIPLHAFGILKWPTHGCWPEWSENISNGYQQSIPVYCCYNTSQSFINLLRFQSSEGLCVSNHPLKSSLKYATSAVRCIPRLCSLKLSEPMQSQQQWTLYLNRSPWR